MRILVLAEHRRGALRDITRELVSAGAELKAQSRGELALAVLARDPSALAESAYLQGIDELIEVETVDEEFVGDVYRHALGQLVEDVRPAVVLLGFTVDSMGFAPAVAASLGLGFASDIVACRVDGGTLSARRNYYGGKVEAELEFPGAGPVLLLLRPTVWPPAGRGEPPMRRRVELALDPALVRTRHVRHVEPPESEIDLTKAEVILAIGRGVGDKDAIAQFEELAEKMGATLSVSRPLVDAGWVPSERQVGQSGKTVKPKVYLAFGISGAVQHLAGMKQSGTIIAVNTDPEAAIFNVAHYGAVADLFEVAEELEKLY